VNVLAIDTCLGAVSVAVRWRDAGGEWRVRDAYEARSTGHAERLMPMIAEVMEAAGLDFPDLERIAVTVGPGTFTGVRAGVAAARGLALAARLPVVGATSLAVMAHRVDLLLGVARGGRLVAVAVDARREMVYAQLFSPELQDEGAAALLTSGEVARRIGDRPVVVVGSGAASVASAVRASGGRADVALPDLQPHAASLAQMAPGLAPAAPLLPLYLRPPDVRPQDDKSLPRVAP
jgi:tRNA threonylcarbamoyladenosine biosynthesis protein TsaB